MRLKPKEMIMLRLAAVSFYALFMTEPALAADLSAPCRGLAGKWQVEGDSTVGKDGVWKSDLSDGAWEVKLTGPSKCRFFKDGGAIDFDVDLSHKAYELTIWEDGKASPAERHEIVSAAIKTPQSWIITVQAPHRSGASHYTRVIMMMTGGIFTAMLSSALTAGGPYVPQSVTFHRRVK